MRLVQCPVFLWRKPQSFSPVPVPHERRTVASSFVCTAVSLCGEPLLFPTFPPGLPPSTPTARQTSASLNGCELLTWCCSLWQGGRGDISSVCSPFLEWFWHYWGGGDHGILGANSSLLVGWGWGTFIPGLLVCAPHETEGNLQVPDWVCKFRVFVQWLPPLCSKRWKLSCSGRHVSEPLGGQVWRK